MSLPCRAFLKSPARDAMFIVGSLEKNPSPVGVECQHCAPDGAWNFIGNGGYKHCAPTELNFLKCFINSQLIIGLDPGRDKRCPYNFAKGFVCNAQKVLIRFHHHAS